MAEGVTVALREEAFGQSLINFVALFSRELREVKELLYLFEYDVLLDGGRIRRTFGFTSQIDYEPGIRQTLEWFRFRR